jgi:hypothetical protein
VPFREIKFSDKIAEEDYKVSMIESGELMTFITVTMLGLFICMVEWHPYFLRDSSLKNKK